MTKDRFIMSVIRRLPTRVIRWFAGPPLVIDGNQLDPNLHLLANQVGKPDGRERTVEQIRALASSQLKIINGARRPGIRVTESTIPGSDGPLAIRTYEPEKLPPSAPAILFFHQGGLVIMDLDTGDPFCTILADECQARVISLDYRRCPESPFPTAIHDAIELWDHLQENADGLGIDRHRMAVAGDSAGGLIAANLSQLLGDRAARPVAQLLIYPWVVTESDADGSMISCADCFPLDQRTIEFFNSFVFPDGVGMDHPLANPGAAADLSGLPPAVLATAGFDPIRDQGDAYAERLQEAGVVVVHRQLTELCHGFVSLGNASQAAVDASVLLARDLHGILQQDG